MKMSQIARTAAFLATVTGTVTAMAAPPNLNGSDTLEPLISSLISTNCGGDGITFGSIVYVGGGSGTGGQAMVDQLAPQPATGGPFEQIAAPQSRAISGSECTAGQTKLASVQTSAEGIALGLDAIVVVTDSASSAACGGGHAARTGTSAPAVPFSDAPLNGSWKTTLRALYTGFNPATNANGQCSAASNPTRAALAEDYKQLFNTGCTSTGCTGVGHAFRRGDRSGTTDTFLSLIGAPSINLTTGAPFCNGTEGQDNDPIRRSCSQDEQVCEADGTLGLVLPVLMPTASNVLTELYGPASSAPVSKLKPALGTACANPPSSNPDPTGLRTSPCGGNVVFNLPAGCSFPNSPRCDCRYPVPSDYTQAVVTGTTTPCPGGPFLPNFDFNWNRRAGGCPAVVDGGSPSVWGFLNGDNGTVDNSPATWGARTVKAISGTPAWRPTLATAQRCCNVRCAAVPPATSGVTAFIREDTRVMNLQWRNNSNGRIRDFSNPTATSPGFTPAFYRIYSTTSGLSSIGQTGYTAKCEKVDATDAIGCFAQSSTCNVGFAGREAWLNDFAEPLSLGNGGTGVDPSTASVQSGAYPLARKLYYNSLVGFSNSAFTSGTPFQLEQNKIKQCIQGNGAGYKGRLAAAGFIELPAGPAVEPMCP